MKKSYILIIGIFTLLTIINISISFKQTNPNKKDETITIINKTFTHKDKFDEKKIYYNKTNYETFNKIFKEK